MGEIAKDQSFPRDPDRTDVGVIGGTWTNTVTGVIWDYIGRYNIKAEKLMSVGYIWERHVGDNSSSGGGGIVTPTATAKAVNFRDYDGTVLYSYTVDEAAALTELPPLPEHSGLVCQGWNWSLDNIKAMGRAVEVGAMYITDDGKTRIYIHLEDGRTSPMLGCCPDGTVTVDWGDGTEPDTLTGTSTSTVVWTPTHEYGSAGDYMIKLTVDGSVGFAGNSSDSQYSYLLRYSSGADTRNQVYQNAIRKVEIGDSVTSISGSAFYNCYSLASITIPNSVTSIGTNAFSYCRLLSSITIPNSVRSIGDGAFKNCSSLASITIPSSVTSLRSEAFYNCSSLSSITIPNSVTSIDHHAFYYCSSLSSITIPNSIIWINNGTFQSCSSLTSITIPDGVRSIGGSAFSYCHLLSSVTIPNSVTSIDGNAFDGCSSLSSITIPNSVTSIGSNAFSSCSSLSSITIPNSVTSIGSNAFSSCSSLSSITIPNSVRSIGTSAFVGCSSLASITIPNGVTSIGNGTFQNCYGVRYYDFAHHTEVPTLSSTFAFNGIAADCEIRVPILLYEEWIAATNWSTYADHIVYVGTPYHLDVSSNDGGTVTPSGQVFAPPGCTRVFKITPDNTHDLSDITLDGASVKTMAMYTDASSNSVSVETVDGASYGFALNESGYYESQNKGKSNSAAVCKIAITVAVETATSLDIINSGESGYDYGLLGAVDQVLTTTSTADSGVAWSGMGKSSTAVVNVPFTIPAGTHYIYAKFIKDGSGDRDNDSLQFKVNLPTESHWSYTIENIQSDHDIVVTFGVKGA